LTLITSGRDQLLRHPLSNNIDSHIASWKTNHKDGVDDNLDENFDENILKQLENGLVNPKSSEGYEEHIKEVIAKERAKELMTFWIPVILTASMTILFGVATLAYLTFIFWLPNGENISGVHAYNSTRMSNSIVEGAAEINGSFGDRSHSEIGIPKIRTSTMIW
jgi:hypothetical protein